ncbi:MAG: hypothetical protein KA419_07730 [Acidobacteria bacterium]|nr:hypothetical protein [Acidobacteriota bacterium]
MKETTKDLAPAESNRREYEKPRLRVIRLVAEEVLALGCKSSSIRAAGQPQCFNVPCSDNGS